MRFDSIEDLVNTLKPDIRAYEEYLQQDRLIQLYREQVTAQIYEMWQEGQFKGQYMDEDQYAAFRGVAYFVYSEIVNDIDMDYTKEDGLDREKEVKELRTGNEEPTPLQLSSPQYDSHLMQLVDNVVQDYMVYQKMLENEGVGLHGMSFSDWYALPKPKNPHFEDGAWYNGH